SQQDNDHTNLYRPLTPPHPHSFPPRRSSDLLEQLGVRRARGLGRRELEHLDLGELVDAVQPLARPARGARLGAEAVRQADVLPRSEEHTSELQSRGHLVCRLLLEKKKNNNIN